MPTTQAQQDYFRQNTVKDATKRTWMTFSFTNPDWNESIDYVAIEDDRGVEFDESIYTFKGVQYKPVSMTYKKPNEGSDNGKATVTFARAATTLKKLMRQRTPQNVNKPITFEMNQWLEGVDDPVYTFNAFVAKNFPKISGQDIQIQAAKSNPSLSISDNIATVVLYPELRTA